MIPKPVTVLLLLAPCAALLLSGQPARRRRLTEIKLITADPGHFHAGLVQKEMYPGVSPQVHVYAPFGADLIDHLTRVARFNARPENPTSWQMEIHASPDFFERLLKERPGNVVVFSGRNKGKIDRIKACVDAGLSVLADKPWIIRPEDLPTLEAALDEADRKGISAYDIMTERYEITSILQRELVNDPGTFGSIVPGSEAEPAVYMESVHHLAKLVAGVPLLRPAWFFDIEEQGEALSDVGTHLVDLIQWTLLPDKAVDYRKDIRLLSASRWPEVMDEAQFKQVTGEAKFPAYLARWIQNGKLNYFCNTRVCYALRGVHVKLDVLWRYQAPEGGGDTHFAVYRGSRSRVEVRQRKQENFRPELYVVPVGGQNVRPALDAKVAALQKQWPGIAVEDAGGEYRVTIPDRYRVGHEAHFAQVTNQFLRFLKGEAQMPAWEKPNMMAKYFVTTKGVELSKSSTLAAHP